MSRLVTLNVNGQTHQLEVDPETPLLYVLRRDLGLKGAKFGCGLEQCNACKVLVDGNDVPSCQLPVAQVEGLEVVTLEGLGTAGALHPLQEAFIEEQAIQCGYCVSGMIIAAQGLLNRTRYPTDDDIRSALSDNICRCGVYERVRRAIKMRIGRPIWEPIYEVISEPGALSESAPALVEGALPPSLRQTPALDAWIRINDDETITVFTGKAEIGQGIATAAAQVAAEELDVALARIKVHAADTGQTPDEGITAGSMSLQTTGNAIRLAAAEARQVLLALAHEELEAETPPEGLAVDDGTISDPATGRQTTYWALFGGRLFGQPIRGIGRPKKVATHRLVGKPAQRLDLPAKVAGEPSFVHDMELPGMAYGRVVRPPGYGARLLSVDEATIKQMPGVLAVVRDGSFLAVIAEREDEAVRAREALAESAVWRDETALPPAASLTDHLLRQPAQVVLIKNGTAVADPVPAGGLPAGAAQTLQATYTRPYHMHASLGTSAAVARLDEDGLTVWSHTQGVFVLRDALAQVMGLAAGEVRVIHAEGSGCYGHNGADDVALDAALLARALPGRPVSVQWLRADEHLWEPYGAAMVVKMQAGLAGNGHIAAWNHDVWSYPHTSRPRVTPGHSGLLAAWHLEQAWPAPAPRFIFSSHFGSYRNADPLYDLPAKRVVAHFVADSPLRTSSLRSLGAYANVFAIESFMDELALAAGADPVAFRLRHLTDERARAVIRAAAEKAGWEARSQPAGQGRGRGIAFAQYKNQQCYAAVIVDLTVARDSGEIRLQRAVIAADAGQIVNPDGLSNQLEGGLFQSASWTLMEQVAFDEKGILSEDWDSYPILRFSGSPVIETVLINRPHLPFLGSGEATQGPTAAAIANAIYDAVGVRLRDLPLTAARVLSALPAR